MAGDPAPRRDESQRNDPAAEALYASAPPELVAEILRGVVMMSPRPRPAHGRFATRLAARLGRSFDDDEHTEGPGGWVFIAEPELRLGSRPDRVVPDLAGWRVERMRSIPADSAIEAAPDWVCEVLSPSTEDFDRGVKMSLFAEHGVTHAWLVDPDERFVEVFRLERGALRQVQRTSGEDAQRLAPFDATALDLASLWTRKPPPSGG